MRQHRCSARIFRVIAAVGPAVVEEEEEEEVVEVQSEQEGAEDEEVEDEAERLMVAAGAAQQERQLHAARSPAAAHSAPALAPDRSTCPATAQLQSSPLSSAADPLLIVWLWLVFVATNVTALRSLACPRAAKAEVVAFGKLSDEDVYAFVVKAAADMKLPVVKEGTGGGDDEGMQAADAKARLEGAPSPCLRQRVRLVGIRGRALSRRICRCIESTTLFSGCGPAPDPIWEKRQ